MININFINDAAAALPHQFYFLDSTLALPPKLVQLDANKICQKFLDSTKSFTGKFGQVQSINMVFDGILLNIHLIGIGEAEKLDAIKTEQLGGKIYQIAKSLKIEQIFVSHEVNLNPESLAFGLLMGSYSFDHYKTVDKSEKVLKECIFASQDASTAQGKFEFLHQMQKAIFMTRDFVSEVPNVLNTIEYANRIVKELAPFKTINVQTLSEEEMRKLGMNALLGVGQGSGFESKLVIMHYKGDAQSGDKTPIALVGKGVVFDSGGISLKPADNMHDMKYDMAGSACVVGAIRALAATGAKVNAVGVVAIVENMPDGNAQRPGDVVKTMSGQTVEVLNTDAEGRLILADALWYTHKHFSPAAIIDVATLTGAIIVALGNTFAGCFSNDDTLVSKLIDAGKKVNEKLWHMPLHEDFEAMIKSEVADWANIGNMRGAAGSSTAAHFLEKFVAGTSWAHLDIAGLAWEKRGKETCPKGATGYGVRLLTQFIKDNYESK